jgi:hypothetical protein
MYREGFEPMIPVFEQPKTVRSLDSAAIITGPIVTYNYQIFPLLIDRKLSDTVQ